MTLYEAVKLCEAVRVVGRSQVNVIDVVMPAAIQRPARRRVAAAVFALAACAALLFSLKHEQAPTAADGQQTVAQQPIVAQPTLAKTGELHADAAGQLAMMWLAGQAIDDDGYFDEGTRYAALPEPPTRQEQESTDDAELPPMDEPTAPDWLIAALAETVPPGN